MEEVEDDNRIGSNLVNAFLGDANDRSFLSFQFCYRLHRFRARVFFSFGEFTHVRSSIRIRVGDEFNKAEPLLSRSCGISLRPEYCQEVVDS